MRSAEPKKNILSQFGGPLLRDKIFFFGSAERILESRQLNFQFLPTTPPILVQLEAPFNLHTKIYDTRARGKLDEQLGRHRLSQQFNLTNTHVTDYLPLLAAINLPSTRNNFDTRRLMLGFNDTSTLGDQARPYLLNVFVQYRGEPAVTRPAHPEAGTASTLDNLFSGLSTGQLFGDQGQVQFGPGHTNLLIDQKYVSIGANLAKQIRRHDVKFGWDFQRTHVDRSEEHTSELQSLTNLVCRLLLEKKKRIRCLHQSAEGTALGYEGVEHGPPTERWPTNVNRTQE